MNHWVKVREQAVIGFNKKTVYKSFVQGKPYTILKVDPKRILIGREEGKTPVYLTSGEVNRVAERVRAIQAMDKASMLKTVAKEVMLIHLHPDINWHKQLKKLIWKPSAETSPLLSKAIENASDDEREKAWVLLTRRLFQSDFSKNLKTLYSNKCAISGCTVGTLLQAAHIDPFAKTGNNRNENGILLRVDLHVLFDRGLLKIHPETFKVHVDKNITEKEYRSYNGKQLAKTTEGNYPSRELLEKKWKEKPQKLPK